MHKSSLVLHFDRGKVPLSWKRYGTLVRKGPPNKPKIGSSRGKVLPTRVRGVRKVLNDLEAMIKEIQKLEAYDTKKRKMGKLNKYAKSVVVSSIAKIK